MEAMIRNSWRLAVQETNMDDPAAELTQSYGILLLDTFLGNAVCNMEKPLKAVEDTDDQCSAFNKLGKEQLRISSVI